MLEFLCPEKGEQVNGKYKDWGERNEIPFSALTVWYLPGLDHETHTSGMGAYREYFKGKTDGYIERVVVWLKEYDEFDNKIFIITSDHGHTATADTDADCKLRLEGFKDDGVKETEKQSNNNLHIWELGNLLTNFVPAEARIKLLAPAELNNTGLNLTQDPDRANVIVALNGPMAHIYVRGTDWQSDPDQRVLGIVIDALIRTLTLGDNASDKVKKEFPNLSGSVEKILVRKTLQSQYEVVTSVIEDADGNLTISTDSLDSLDNNPEYVKPSERIRNMNEPNRSGDIVLIFKFNTSGGLNARYTSGVSCRSWHGSLNRSDSYVPFIIAYPGGNKYEIEAILKSADVCDTDYSKCKYNWKLPDIIKKIINMQYKER